MSKSRIEPYVSFPGNAEEAIAFYEKVFDTKPSFISRFKDLPEGNEEMQGDPEQILHATVPIGETPLMVSDDPGPTFQSGNQIGLTWSTDDETELKQVWKRFIEGGAKVEMELEPAFFARQFGVITDPFGVQWMLMLYDETDENWSPS